MGTWIVWWVISAIWVYSVGDIYKSEGSPFAKMHWSTATRYVWIYHIFGMFWISAFIIGCAQFIIAAVCSLWYFAQGGNSDDKAKASMRMGFKWIFRYHVGSIAFGAMLIAIMQMIKLIFEYAARKIEKASGGNQCVKCLLCMVRCCIHCLDACVKFITKNAYIQVALTSKNFCTSALQGWSLFVRNAARFGMSMNVGAILIFVGKMIICALSGWIGYIILMNSYLKDEIYSPVFPVIVVIGIAWLLASVTLSVFTFSAQTILHCFLIDEEIGGNRHPDSLKEFLKINDEQVAARKGRANQQEAYKDGKGPAPPTEQHLNEKNSN